MPVRAQLSPSLLLIGFGAAACIYLFFLEPWGHDTWFHLQRLQDIRQQVGDGRYWVHFAENAAQGKGIPVWIYYSQWAYWPAALLTLLGATPLIALKIVYCILLGVIVVGCYRLLALYADEPTAALGTLLFVTSNYVIGEIFQRSAYAELLSVSFLPLLLVAMHRTVVNGGLRAGLALVVLTALVVLFHPLSFMNAGVALAAFAAYTAIRWHVPFRRLLRLVPPVALALGLTAFYWLPAVIETRYVQGAEGVPTPLGETFLSVWRYLNFSGITTPGFALGVLVAVVCASMFFRRRLSETPRAIDSWPLAAGIAVYALLTFRISEPLYDAVPLLASTLWVWRVLFPMVLLIVIFVTVNFRALPDRLRGGLAPKALVGVAILQAIALVLWNTRSDLSLGLLETRNIETEVGVESRRTGGFGIDEYLPKPRALPRPGDKCRVYRTVAPEGRYQMRFAVAAQEADTCVRIPRYWNTRYAAWIGGAALPVYANAAGEIVIAPSGRDGTVVLRFVRPRYVTWALVVSGVSAVILIAGLAGLAGRRGRTRGLRAATG